MRTAVVRLKYQGRPDLGRPLGAMLRRAVVTAGLSSDLVVPVPLHSVRLAERGFNQASLLAREVAEACGRFSVALRRREARQRQASLGREERLANLGGAFVADGVRGRTIMLVDDVCTTGATLLACEQALLEAGATSVTPVALLRADP